MKQNTYDRIVDASLELFNRDGERNVSTNHIAAYLGISPGNLYYHFRNKNEIIMQLFIRYRDDMLHLLNSEATPLSSEDMIKFMIAVFDSMWRYRFFFADVNTLLSRSTELSGEHQSFTWAHVSPLIFKHFKNLVNSGVCDMDDETIDGLTLNIWLISRYWYVFDGSIHNKQLPEHSKMRGIRQVLGLLKPYVAPSQLPKFNEVYYDLTEKINVLGD